MSTVEATELSEVIDRIRSWPALWRITLARRILESLENPPALLPPRQRGLSAEEAAKLFQPVVPAPSDDECQRVVEEELAKKYCP